MTSEQNPALGRLTRRALIGAAVATPIAVKLARAQSTSASASVELSNIKALTFDIQGTVVDYYQPLLRVGEELNQRKGLAIDWDKFSREWLAGTRDPIAAIVAGKSPWIPAGKVFRAALDKALDKDDLSSKFSDAERVELLSVFGKMVPWPDTVEGVTRLKRCYTVATLSNAGMASVLAVVKNGGIPFDTVLTAELVHSYKPAAPAYRLAVDYLGFRPDQIMMVACHKWDLKAANGVGFRTAFLPRPLENGPGVEVSTTPEAYIDVMAADLVDLAAKLGA
jgi:2-haloacid dehalogenase